MNRKYILNNEDYYSGTWRYWHLVNKDTRLLRTCCADNLVVVILIYAVNLTKASQMNL